MLRENARRAAREGPMSDIFDGSADFYDALYASKDYPGECDYLEEIFRRYDQRRVRTVVDIGCGTGGHALLLAGRGYDVTGVDRSPKMLRSARAKAASVPLNGRIRFEEGDLRTLALERTFDAAVA